MANLTDQQRIAVLKDLMQVLCQTRQPIALTKPQLLNAVAAADSWIDANSASFNTALPAAARSGLTASQKGQILAFVATHRHRGGV